MSPAPRQPKSLHVLSLFLLVVGVAASSCKGNEPSAPLPPPAPALPPPPPAPPPPPPPVPDTAPASPLRTAILAAQDLTSFRALMGEQLTLIKLDAKERPGKPIVVASAKLDEATFDRRIKPVLPHEPRPEDGEGEDFSCDDAHHSCLFSDSQGRHTTYVFSAATPPSLQEIRFPDPARASKTKK